MSANSEEECLILVENVFDGDFQAAAATILRLGEEAAEESDPSGLASAGRALQSAVAPAFGPLGISEACQVADIVRAAQAGKRVARALESGDVVRGTARSIGDQQGGYLAKGEDIRAAYLRVTLETGFEAFWSMVEVMAALSDTTLVIFEDKELPRAS